MLLLEKQILNSTVDIWNNFTQLEQTHPDDIIDLKTHIHRIQKILAMRLARRTYPEVFKTYKRKDD